MTEGTAPAGASASPFHLVSDVSGQVARVVRADSRTECTKRIEVPQPLPAIATSQGAPGRAHRQMVCTGDSLLVFGGQSKIGGTSQGHNDLWKLTLATSTWEQLTPSGTLPPARSQHSAVWNPDTQSMLVYGGADSTFLGDLWSYSLTANSWTQLTPTGGPLGTRDEHTALWNPVDNTMLLTGGTRRHASLPPAGSEGNDLWSYDPQANTWTELIPQGSPNAPAGRRQTSLVWNTAAQAALLFAGNMGSPSVLNDLWEYKAASNWTQLVPATSPPARHDHQAVWASTQAGDSLEHP